MSQQPTWRHHYIPEFYLKRWTDRRSGQLVEFSKPWGNEVKPKRVSPRQTGFMDRLYELQGLSPENASRLEKEYFAPVDTRAADVLAKIEHGRWDFTERERTAWGQFLLALVTRHPRHVQAVKEHVHRTMTSVSPEEERRWSEQRKDGDAPTMQEALADPQTHAYIDRAALRLMTGFSQSEKLGTHLVNMQWAARTLPFDVPALMTSDRPLQWFGALSHENCHLIMPLGPKRVFWACNTPDMMSRIRRMPALALVNFMNDAVVRRAVSFVYALGESRRAFVQEVMGVSPEMQPPDRLIIGMGS